MRKVIVFLYFVFIFKLAFANSLPSINVFGDEKLSNIEPASGLQVAQNTIPELPSMQDSEAAPLPEDFNLPTLESDNKEEVIPDNSKKEATTTNATEEFESAPLPPTAGVGSVPTVPSAEVSDMPTLPQQQTEGATQEAPKIVEKTNTPENSNPDNINIDQIISESSVREQFPETPELNKGESRKREEEQKVIPISSEERTEEVDSLLNEVFDKGKTPEDLAKEEKDIEKDKKLKEELSNKEQLDLPIMEDVVSVDEQNIQPLDSLAEFSDDSEQLPLGSMPDSMKDNYQPQISSSGKVISSSNTYSEQRLSELLVSAAMRGDKKSVIDLINSGRSPNSQNQFGETALMGAVYSGNNEIIEILLSEGADVNLLDSKGNTALIVASAKNNVQATQQLVKAGADIDIANNASDTPILVAALNNNNQVLDVLVREGGDINKANAEGLTALHIAAYNDNAQLVRYLLNLGANPNMVAKGGYKPYDLLRDKSGQSAQLLVAYANDIQRKLEAQKMAYEVKAKNAAPVAKNIYANADQYAVFPKAYSQNEEQKPASVALPKSDWWAAKNEEQPMVKANYAKQLEESQQQPVDEMQFEDLNNQNINSVTQKPASIAFREMFSGSVAPQKFNQNFRQVPTQVTNKMQKSLPVDNVEVQTLNIQTQTSAPKIVEQPKQWRKLTVDQASLKKDQEAKIIQQNQPMQVLPQNNDQQQLVRAVYDDRGNIISQNALSSAPQVTTTPLVAPVSTPANQPASFAINNLNQQRAMPVVNNRQMQNPALNKIQIQTMPQAQSKPAAILQNSYNQLDSSKQQAWDLRLQQWVKDGYFFSSFNDTQKAAWLGQQKVFESVYQDQFNFKVEAIKKQLTGGAPNNVSQSGANNYYGQQDLSHQGAMVTSYALGQAPLSQTF